MSLQFRNDRPRLCRRHVELGVLGAQMRRDLLGMGRLVIGRLAKADREGADGSRAVCLHQRRDRRGIDAARQKHAERHVGDHAPAHGVGEQRFQHLLRGCVRYIEQRGLAARGDLRQRPVGRVLDLAVFAAFEQRPGRELVDPPIDAHRRRHIAVAQERRRARRDRSRPASREQP